MISNARQQSLVFDPHLLVALLLLHDVCHLLHRGVGAQVRHREAAVVRERHYESFQLSDFNYVHVDRRCQGLRSPDQLHVLVDHQVVGEGPQNEAETRGVMSVLRNLGLYRLPLLTLEYVSFACVIHFQAGRCILQTPLISDLSICLIQHEERLLADHHYVLLFGYFIQVVLHVLSLLSDVADPGWLKFRFGWVGFLLGYVVVGECLQALIAVALELQVGVRNYNAVDVLSVYKGPWDQKVWKLYLEKHCLMLIKEQGPIH